MTDLDWLTAIVGAHLGHSVALSAVLACSLIFSRRMSGGGRYALCSFALLGAIILPAIALAPGASLVNRALEAVDAPIMFSESAPQEAPAAAKPGALPSSTGAVASGGNGWTAELAADASDGVTYSFGSKFSLSLSSQESTGASTPAGTAQDLAAVQTDGGQSTWLVDAVAAAGSFFARLPDMTLFFFSAWAVGSVVLLAKTGRDLVASLRMVKGSREIELPAPLARRFANVRIAVSDQAPGPIAAGVINPSILLPVGFESELERPGIVALLEHERAHVERRDMLVALGQRIALSLFWWSPAMHWISRRMDEEREVACDEIAVERTGDPRAFALTLTHQAESQLWAQTPRLAAGAIGGRSQFGRRISRLVDLARGGKSAGGNARTSGRFAFTGMALVAFGAAILTPGIPARAQDAEQELYDEADRSEAPIVRIRADQTPPLPPAAPAPPASLSEPVPVTPLPPVAPLSPELSDSIDDLAMEAAQLGIDISALVSEDILEELPDLLEEIFESLEETGFTDDEFSSEWRAELAQMRQELGPELRIHITRELDRARQEQDRAIQRETAAARAEREWEMAEARREMARARAEMDRELGRAQVELARARAELSRALTGPEARNMSAEEREEIREEVREALEEAREQIREARESGEFDVDFDLDFDLDSNDVDEFDQDADAPLDGGVEGGSRRGPNAGDFYREFDLEDLKNLSGPRSAPADVEDHATATAPSLRTIGRNDCPQRG